MFISLSTVGTVRAYSIQMEKKKCDVILIL